MYLIGLLFKGWGGLIPGKDAGKSAGTSNLNAVETPRG